MALKLDYYGQNDGTCVPNVALTGDPAVDQPALAAAGFKGGRIMTIIGDAADGNGSFKIAPCDAAGIASPATNGAVPYGSLINGGGEYATSIGPSGSKKAPVVRAMWKGAVDSEAYKSGDSFKLGAFLYCGGGADAGLFCAGLPANTHNYYTNPVGICTHLPTALEPWLGVASLL